MDLDTLVENIINDETLEDTNLSFEKEKELFFEDILIHVNDWHKPSSNIIMSDFVGTYNGFMVDIEKVTTIMGRPEYNNLTKSVNYILRVSTEKRLDHMKRGKYQQFLSEGHNPSMYTHMEKIWLRAKSVCERECVRKVMRKDAYGYPLN